MEVVCGVQMSLRAACRNMLQWSMASQLRRLLLLWYPDPRPLCSLLCHHAPSVCFTPRPTSATSKASHPPIRAWATGVVPYSKLLLVPCETRPHCDCQHSGWVRVPCTITLPLRLSGHCVTLCSKTPWTLSSTMISKHILKHYSGLGVLFECQLWCVMVGISEVVCYCLYL